MHNVSTFTSFRLVWDYVPPKSSPTSAMDDSHTQYRPDPAGASEEEEGEGEGEGEDMDVLCTDLFNAKGCTETRPRLAKSLRWCDRV